MAKTRGGALQAPAYREENIAVAGKLSILDNTARKGLPQVRWGRINTRRILGAASLPRGSGVQRY